MASWKRYSLNIVLLIFLLTLSITLTINARWLYVFDLTHLNIAESVGMTSKDILANYDQLMRYLNYVWVNPLHMADFGTSESGAFHFYEVKQLFQLNYGLFLLTILPSIWYVRSLIKTNELWSLVRPIQWLLTGISVLVFFMIVGFNQFFVLFHEVFFNNDDWLFDPFTDPIITVLPQDYFMHCFILFFVFFIFFLMLLLCLGRRQFNRFSTK